MTYREFVMISNANVDRTHDENERLAMTAIMNAVASRGKGKKGTIPKLEDLYKRPSEDDKVKKVDTPEDLRKKQAESQAWISKFDLDKLGKEDDK